MPKDVFHFKKFSVYQPHAGMKVSTDACIQAAVCIDFFKRDGKAGSISSILDIGTGTGLLSLMLAQSLEQAGITAVEIDENALKDAAYNFERSPWSNNIRLIHSSVQDVDPAAQFDLIICNPPFFQDQLQSPREGRNKARHDIFLSKTILAEQISIRLPEEGIACVMYPVREWQQWESTRQAKGLYPVDVYAVLPNSSRPANRMIGIYSKKATTIPLSKEIVIYHQDRTYTEEMKRLLKDFYLNF